MSNLDLKNAAFGTCFAQSAKYEIIKNIVVQVGRYISCKNKRSYFLFLLSIHTHCTFKKKQYIWIFMAGTFKGEIGMVSKWYGGGKYSDFCN